VERLDETAVALVFPIPVWECTATPNDGADDGATATDSVTVEAACGDGSVTLTASGIDCVTVCGGTFDMG
jgi:hypothetical protein